MGSSCHTATKTLFFRISLLKALKLARTDHTDLEEESMISKNGLSPESPMVVGIVETSPQSSEGSQAQDGMVCTDHPWEGSLSGTRAERYQVFFLVAL